MALALPQWRHHCDWDHWQHGEHRCQRVQQYRSASRAEHHRQLGYNLARLVTTVQDCRSDTALDSGGVSGNAQDTTLVRSWL